MKTITTSALALAAALTANAAPQALSAQETTTMAEETEAPFESENDPFIWLEEARSVPALSWVRSENERVDQTLGNDPRFAELKAEALAILDSEDRIPYVSFTPHGLMNFWQDAKNPKGVLRLTTLDSYRTDSPQWETVLDIDALAREEGREWVFAGFNCLPPEGNRCMVGLSDGGKDANEMREFDVETRQFVDGGFRLSESQGGGLSATAWLASVVFTRSMSSSPMPGPATQTPRACSAATACATANALPPARRPMTSS